MAIPDVIAHLNFILTHACRFTGFSVVSSARGHSSSILVTLTLEDKVIEFKRRRQEEISSEQKNVSRNCNLSIKLVMFSGISIIYAWEKIFQILWVESIIYTQCFAHVDRNQQTTG